MLVDLLQDNDFGWVPGTLEFSWFWLDLEKFKICLDDPPSNDPLSGSQNSKLTQFSHFWVADASPKDSSVGDYLRGDIVETCDVFECWMSRTGS